MIRINIRKNRYHWEAPAAVNFFLGGLGAGLFVWHWVISLWPVEQQIPSAGTHFIPLISACLVALGFGAVAFEAGRPLRGIYVALNFKTAWMSREIIFGWSFIFLSILGYFFPSPVLAFPAVLCAGLFVFSQVMVLYRSQGITSWDTWLLPVLLVCGDLCAGYGVCLLLGLTATGVLIGGILILGMHAMISVFYFKHLQSPGLDKNAERFQGTILKYLLRNDAVGVWIPLAGTLLLLSGGCGGTMVALLCGVCTVLGTGYKIWNIVCKTAFIRPMAIEKPSPETVSRESTR